MAGRPLAGRPAVSAHNKTLQLNLCVCLCVYFPGPVVTVKHFGHNQRNYYSSIALVIRLGLQYRLVDPASNDNDSSIGESCYMID